jgi:hypothetical protein
MMPRRRALWAILPLVLGCAGVATQQVGYIAAGAPAARPLAPALVVVPFADGRPPRAYPVPTDDAFMLALPFVPSVSLDYERLDESRAAELLIRGALPTPDDFFEVQLARAVAADLASSHLFAAVQFATAAPADADLLLVGTIVSTRFTATTTSYYLGMPGLLLWLTGLPNGRDSVDMAIDLELRDRRGAVLWQYPLHADATRLVLLYTPSHPLSTGAGSLSIPVYGANPHGIDPDSLWAFHSEALRIGMEGARRSLAAHLGHAE